MSLMEWSPLARDAVAFALGAVTAVFNIAAGGGSMLTLPLLVEFGLTAQQANATNRIGVILQALAGASTFARGGTMPWRWVMWLMPSCWLGAIGGAWLSMVLDEAVFRRSVGAVFVVLGIYLLWNRLQRGRGTRVPGLAAWVPAVDFAQRPGWFYRFAFVAIGLYGGFIQGGVGILMLTVMYVIGRGDVVRSNAMKTALIVGFTVPAMWMFARSGLIHWREGAALAVGGVVGGWAGARLASRVRPEVLEGLLVVGVFLAAGRFLGLY